ncbi:hypothetical protein LU276_06115 [Moraxella haemolytica]|uniref:hypothetical protein n=1 Tax=Moraxella TaxID=475 RepID=UPI002543BC5E|nr:hypothetical protein [Moraxella sp. ZY171148]WII94604.1 hypothetical protein LU276_06115 [Moraxella sp. ZY171148]
MNNDNFIKQLNHLAHNRFALNSVNINEYQQFRQQLLALFDITNVDATWYLLGTDGCHLCDDTHRLYHYANQVRALPTLQVLDLANITNPNHKAFEVLGMMIPILMTPTRLLCYPFGVMDIASLPIP